MPHQNVRLNLASHHHRIFNVGPGKAGKTDVQTKHIDLAVIGQQLKDLLTVTQYKTPVTYRIAYIIIILVVKWIGPLQSKISIIPVGMRKI